MDWPDFGVSVVSAIAALMAAVFAGWSVYQSVVANRLAEASVSAARESADAAKESVSAARESADAAKASAATAADLLSLERAREIASRAAEVMFQGVDARGQDWTFSSAGPAPARMVEIEIRDGNDQVSRQSVGSMLPGMSYAYRRAEMSNPGEGRSNLPRPQGGAFNVGISWIDAKEARYNTRWVLEPDGTVWRVEREVLLPASLE